MILKTPIDRYRMFIEKSVDQKSLVLTKFCNILRALHSFVKKSGREILHNNSSQGNNHCLELSFVFHAHIFHKTMLNRSI